ncbi:MAG: type II toxin-antitoxin system PemK/MazF family toxin [Lachnospiraceae bacterium]
MSKGFTKDDVIQHKKKAIKTLNSTLEEFINDPSNEHLKKANLIAYWIENFAMYVKSEETFTPTRLLRYSRGNVIRVNFGFNIGKEFGGLHYAVVIDNDNKRNADVLTVIPLSSTDGKEVHERSVDLGAELYKKISDVQNKLLLNANNELDELKKLNKSFSTALAVMQNIKSDDIPSDVLKKIDSTIKFKRDIEIKEAHIEQSIKIIKRNNNEIQKLKIGSMALVNQITTISKQRIYTPKHAEDFLYGISLSSSAMDKINDKIKELYVFS